MSNVNWSEHNVLYHYTSWDNFEKIVKNHTWRFSSINGTNDLSEDLNLYVKQLLCDKNLINNISSDMKQEIIHQIDIDNYYNFKKYFIACFSSAYDDLGQWRTSYGDYGRGVCIGINPKFFTKDLYLNNPDKLGWVEIVYNIQLQKQRLSKITSKLEPPDKYWGIDNSDLLAHDIRDIAMTMKHRAFHIEKEWRLIVSMIDNQILDENFHSFEEDYAKSENKRLYFTRNTNPNIQDKFIVKCVDYDINSYVRVGEGKLFNSILLGKECPYNENDVKKLLSNNGFDNPINISKSNIPYRFSDDREKCKNIK